MYLVGNRGLITGITLGCLCEGQSQGRAVIAHPFRDVCRKDDLGFEDMAGVSVIGLA